MTSITCSASSWTTSVWVQTWWVHTAQHQPSPPLQQQQLLYKMTKQTLMDWVCAYDKIDFFLCVSVCFCSSWFRCGTVSCADSTGALCAWSGPTSSWPPSHVSTFRSVWRLSVVTGGTTSKRISRNHIFVYVYSEKYKRKKNTVKCVTTLKYTIRLKIMNGIPYKTKISTRIEYTNIY